MRRAAAPAMMQRRPRGSASSAYSKQSSGIRCAEMTRASYAMPNASSCIVALRMISQSLSLPINTPTSGVLFRCAIGPPRCRAKAVRGTAGVPEMSTNFTIGRVWTGG
jgi:hypothetical protein